MVDDLVSIGRVEDPPRSGKRLPQARVAKVGKGKAFKAASHAMGTSNMVKPSNGPAANPHGKASPRDVGLSCFVGHLVPVVQRVIGGRALVPADFHRKPRCTPTMPRASELYSFQRSPKRTREPLATDDDAGNVIYPHAGIKKAMLRIFRGKIYEVLLVQWETTVLPVKLCATLTAEQQAAFDEAKAVYETLPVDVRTQRRKESRNRALAQLAAFELQPDRRFHVHKVEGYVPLHIEDGKAPVDLVKASFIFTYEHCHILTRDHCTWVSVYRCRIRAAQELIAEGDRSPRLPSFLKECEEHLKDLLAVPCHCNKGRERTSSRASSPSSTPLETPVCSSPDNVLSSSEYSPASSEQPSD